TPNSHAMLTAGMTRPTSHRTGGVAAVRAGTLRRPAENARTGPTWQGNSAAPQASAAPCHGADAIAASFAGEIATFEKMAGRSSQTVAAGAASIANRPAQAMT